MTIKTNKGKEYKAEWSGGPTQITQEVFCVIDDSRAISVIAGEFDGAELTEIQRDGKEKTYTGYTELCSIGRMDEGNLTRISMRKPRKEG